ncbi:hypothetical protein [Mucilaginibacter psychrotolerans]|uniref:Uncharacterized protein n=1 Tax=Mucilaginibacter psychrotolerans TaxID=1524096 RepID=A0A4Y8S828_9SPHI|nr:hypothetical protein [Mucilaginibacter psychrotolerans]TFF35203.1 hypothetical protein E2R66_19760 [Mucilaginibacter psychrotolerans]
MKPLQNISSNFSTKRLVRIIIMLMAISGGAYYVFDYTFFYLFSHGDVNSFFCTVSAFVFAATAYPYYMIPALVELPYPWDFFAGIVTGSIINGLLIEFIIVKYQSYTLKHARLQKLRDVA